MERNQYFIVSSTHSKEIKKDDERRRSLLNRIVVILLLLSSLVIIKCISINNAFPFEMMQIYSKADEEPKKSSNNENNYMSSPRGNFQNQRQDVFRPSNNVPLGSSSAKSTTQRPLPVTSWSTSTTSVPSTSSTTTTEKPTTKKVRRIKLPNIPSAKSRTQQETKKKDDSANGVIDQVKGSEKVSKEKSRGKEPKVEGKSDTAENEEKVSKEGTMSVPEFNSKVMKVTNYDGKKKNWIPFPGKEFVAVETRSGKVQGMKGKVMDHEVNSFLGIPFATPPLDTLRFRKTLPLKPWTGIYNATSYKSHCLQHFDLDIMLARTLTTLEMSEDCLYLNIWTPTLKSDKPKTVMIWIYGGGFKSGSANYDETDGRVLSALGDVVVVTFNYRVGAFGFLDVGTKDSPGNQGLYDAVEAISWVRDNIKAFGGDPNNITLFGHYSGAVMIGLLMVSENTKFWFKRAILQSGSPLFQDFFDGKNTKTSKLFIESVGCQSGEKKDELGCLRDKSVEEILKVQSPLLMGDENSFAPTHCEDLIPTTVVDAIKSSSYDGMTNDNYFNSIESVLMGSNKDELSVSLVMGFPEMFTTKRVNLNLTTLTELRELVIQIFSRGSSGSSFSGMKEGKFVKFLAELFFTEGKEIDTTDNLIKRMYRMFGDAAVACPVTIFGELLFKLGKKVYLYEFNQRAFNTPWGDWMGVAFSTEIPYIFGHPLRYPKVYSKDDLVISRRMIQTWSMFAKIGKVPLQKNVTWEPFSDSLQEFIEINPHHARTGTREKNEVCNLFRVTIDSTNSSYLNCSSKADDGTEVDLRVTDIDEDTGEGAESTTMDYEATTEEPTEPPIIACELFRVFDPREPSVDYIQYEVVDLQIVAILNTSAVFHCDEGQELIGEQVSRCTEDGTWTSPKPTCRRKVYPKGVIPSFTIPRFACDLFEVPEDSPLGPVITYEKYIIVNDTANYAIQGTIARFACKTQGNDLVKLFGQSVITCGKYGIWDSIEPECKVVDETREIKIIEKDIKNQLVIIGLILLVVLAIVYVTFTLYIKLDQKKTSERPSLRMQSLTPDSDQGYYYNRGRTSNDSSYRGTELEPREDELLLRINEEFTEGSEISPEDMEIIDILAKARDESACIVSRPASKQLDDNMNIVNSIQLKSFRRSPEFRRSSRRPSRMSSSVSSRMTRSTTVSDGNGRVSNRSTTTQITRCDTRNSDGVTSSSDPETVLWVYK